ncbi:hypothetical protein STANM309S_03615 [Streptomyces tanashiensis]
MLKNALDWLSTDWTKTEGLPLHRKPTAILGAAPTNFGTVRRSSPSVRSSSGPTATSS